MNDDGTDIGVTGTDDTLSIGALRNDIGEEGLEMLYTIGLSNYRRIIGQQGGTP